MCSEHITLDYKLTSTNTKLDSTSTIVLKEDTPTRDCKTQPQHM